MKPERDYFVARLLYRCATPLLFALMISCDDADNHSPNAIQVAVTNASGNDLDWVELKWDGPFVPGGVLSAGITKSTVDTELPQGKTATIEFVDRTLRTPYSNTISLEKLFTERRDSISKITFRITGYKTIELEVDYRSP